MVQSYILVIKEYPRHFASTAMNGEKPPVTETMTTFLMLPRDLLFNCLARVSRLYYPTLSLVSKRFRSLVASLELYETRTLLGRTESCLYICLWLPHESNSVRWFTLCRKPTQTTDANRKPNPRWFTPCLRLYRFLTKKGKKSSDKNLLVSVPTRNSPHVSWWGLITVGCNIYQVGGYPSSKVMFMDCRSHTWHEGPSMRMVRKFPDVSFLDGKIYVAGGIIDCDSSSWIECFDLKTQIWEHVPRPSAEICKRFMFKSITIEGKLYLFGGISNAVYKPEENRWYDVGLEEVPLGWLPDSSCVIDNVFYCYRLSSKLEWYDFEERCFRALKGLKGLPRLPKRYDCVRLVDNGGNIAVLWEKDVGEDKMIWCAEISLERRNEHEIYGKVEWCSVVLTVPISCKILNLFSVTV